MNPFGRLCKKDLWALFSPVPKELCLYVTNLQQQMKCWAKSIYINITSKQVVININSKPQNTERIIKNVTTM